MEKPVVKATTDPLVNTEDKELIRLLKNRWSSQDAALPQVCDF